MPLDKGRITGFGSSGTTQKVWKCPRGHMLQPWTAQPGSCDGCQRKICKGDKVMDCRQCNYYLCDACHPHEKFGYGDSIWGTFTYCMDAATQEMTELGKDIEAGFEAAVSVMTCSAPDRAELNECEVVVTEKPCKSAISSKEGGKKSKQRERLSVGTEDEVDPKSASASAAVTPAAAASADSAVATREAATSDEQPIVGKKEAAKAQPPHVDLLDFGPTEDLVDLTDAATTTVAPSDPANSQRVAASVSHEGDLVGLFEPGFMAEPEDVPVAALAESPVIEPAGAANSNTDVPDLLCFDDEQSAPAQAPVSFPASDFQNVLPPPPVPLASQIVGSHSLLVEVN